MIASFLSLNPLENHFDSFFVFNDNEDSKK